jgi:hypothetical protein
VNRARSAPFAAGSPTTSLFSPAGFSSPAELREKWDAGWRVLDGALAELTDADLPATVTIRGQALRVHEALHRSLAHTAYHVGQIVYLAKSMRGPAWTSLSIPKGKSADDHRNPSEERPPEVRATFETNLADGVGRVERDGIEADAPAAGDGIEQISEDALTLTAEGRMAAEAQVSCTVTAFVRTALRRVDGEWVRISGAIGPAPDARGGVSRTTRPTIADRNGRAGGSRVVGRIDQTTHGGDAVHREVRQAAVLANHDLVR